MSDITNPLQNTSYTNKDFTSIYTELLDLTKELASTWDPTISNESDPGVVLLKLNAIIGDKLSYNSDTNVLELFPLSVTQEKNARQLFEQLGYYMHWYRAATTDVSIAWIGQKNYESEGYTIPAFTIVSDYNNNVTYTLIGPVDSTNINTYEVSDQKLKLDGSTTAFKAIQGVPVRYGISGETLITVNNLDSNNRLYFTTKDVAENGIFITNVDANNYTSWKKVDNLLVQTLSSETLVYKFGITQDMSTCYIEFPENAEEIFKNGINITYIKTLGEEGNVAYRTIEKFYNEISPVEDSTITLNSDNVKILNYSSAINGRNPQNINSAYKGYKSTVGTFETLVTLRDYINYILNSGLVSNGFVCDRTNDIQCCYNIMTESNGIDQVQTVIEKEGANALLTAFDLKLYLLQLPNQELNNFVTYASTFNLLKSSSLQNVEAYIEDIKCISHDYSDILPITDTSSHFCFFKNKYPISCKVTTQYALTKSAASEVITNIRHALYKALNSAEMTFGEEVSQELVYQTIINADDRIKSIMLDNIEYTTYAVIYDEDSQAFFEVEISSKDEEPVDIETNIDVADIYSRVDISKLYSHIGYGNYETLNFVYVSSNDTWVWNEGVIAGTGALKYSFGIDLTDVSLNNNDYVKINISVKTQLQDEIYTKSVLAGVTQFFIQDETYDYRLDQIMSEETSFLSGIKSIESSYSIYIQDGRSKSGGGTGTYKLKDNESLQLYCPNIIEGTNYSTYVKFEYKLNEDLSQDTDYQLGENEYFIMYWKESSSATFYKYAVYGEGNIIRLSNFELESNVEEATNNFGQELTWYMENIGTEENPILFTSSDVDNRMNATINGRIEQLSDPNNLLSTTKNISLRYLNQITLESADSYCYWILNEKITDDFGVEKYRMFEADGDMSYMLGTGEYFIYTDSAFSNLTILGAGTNIARTDNSYVWEVSVKDASDIVTNGISSFKEDEWFKIVPSSSSAILTEQYFIMVKSGSTVKLELVDNYDDYCMIEIANSFSGTISLNRDKWYENSGKVGRYVFKYSSSASSWQYEAQGEMVNVNLADYGITIDSGSFVNESTITVYSSWILRITNDGIFNYKSDEAYINTDETTYQGTIDFDEEVWFSNDENSKVGTRSFVYDTASSSWKIYKGTSYTSVTLSDYGITISGAPNNEDVICVEVPENKIKNLSDFSIKYKESDDSAYVELPRLSLSNSDYAWTAKTLLSLNVSSDKEQILTSGQEVTVSFKDGIYYYPYDTQVSGNWEMIIHLVDEPTEFYHVAITHSPSGNMKYDSPIMFDKNTEKLYVAGFEYSYVKNDSSDPIYDGYGSGSYELINDDYTILGSNFDSTTNTYPVVLLFNFNIMSDGNGKVSTYTINEDLEIEYLSLYVYSKKLSDSTSVVIKDNGELDLLFTPSGNTSIPIEFKLPTGEYILPINIGTDELEKPNSFLNVYYSVEVNYDTTYTGTITLDRDKFVENAITTQSISGYCITSFVFDSGNWKIGTTTVDLDDYGITISGSASDNDTINIIAYCVSAIGDSYSFNFNRNQRYFLDLRNVVNADNQVNNSHLWFVINGGITKNVPVIVSNIYKFNYPEGFDSGKINRVLGLLKVWDPDNLFNYTYIVDEDEEISNPLEGKTFFLRNHIYNAFTIPQMSGSEINILGKR